MQELALHHICLQTDCYERSLRFYRAALGMELLRQTPDFHGRAYNSWLGNGQLFLELQTPKAGEPCPAFDRRAAGPAHLCFFTHDIEAKLRQLQDAGIDSFLPHGGSVLYAVEGGRLFKLRAPEGTVLEFRENEGF